MPATSTAQQHLMGMVNRYKKGLTGGKKVSPLVKKVARGMTEKQASDFARKPKGMKYHGPMKYR